MTSLPPSIQALLTLFQGPLANVRFADVDAAALNQLAAELETASAEVEQQEAKLSELRQGLAQQHEALLVLAQRALAYARVYAENDEALTQELNGIALPRAAKPRKGGTPKSAEPSAPSSLATESDARHAAALEPSAGSESDPELEDAESTAPAQRKTKRRAKDETLRAEG